MSETACEENAVEERKRKIIGDLRSSGHRITPQRVAIIREFIGREDHPSAEDIHSSLAEDFPMMALSTVYSTLGLLAEMGEAVEVSPATEQRRFDPNVGDHCHLTCLSCGRIVDLPLEACGDASDFMSAARDAGFEPVRGVYQILGYCEQCRDAREDESESS